MAVSRKPSRHNQEKILFILMGLIIMGLIISGYFLFVRKILPELSTATVSNSGASGSTQVVTATGELASATEFIPQDEAQELRIYFGARGQDLLSSELRRVRKSTMLIAQARQIIETVLEGPVNGAMFQSIPKGTTLRGIFFDSGTFIVDLSKEFTSSANLGTTDQLLAAYSLVNSLTELDPKAKVKFLINGTEPTAEEGHLDLSMPLTRLENLVQK